VPVKLQGATGIKARVRRHPYVITLRWNRQPAVVHDI
jgi:chemotaxis protein CheX